MFIIHNFLLCLWLLLLLLLLPSKAQQQQDDFCNFDGIRIPRGQSVGSNFVTRCGPWEEWPCFCNPDALYQVDCPYCGFATNTPNLVKCAKHEEEVSLIALKDDQGKKCTCDLSDHANPVGNCVDDFFADKCMFAVDGRTYWYANGDVVDIVNPCGSPADYPCFCNPNMNGQLYCPYCFVVTGRGTIECLKDDEVKQFNNIFRQDGSQSSCVCDLSQRENLNFPVEASCNLPDGCAVQEVNGATTFYSDGDEIRNREGICGNGYPYICDTSGLSITTDNLKYPYCQFVDQTGNVLCARDGETILLTNRNGEYVRCSCQFASQVPTQECVPSFDTPTTRPPTRAPAVSPTRVPVDSPTRVPPTSLPTRAPRPSTPPLSTSSPNSRPSQPEISTSASTVVRPLRSRGVIISVIGAVGVVLQGFFQ